MAAAVRAMCWSEGCGGLDSVEIAAIVCSRRWYNRYSRRVKPLVAVRLDVARLLGKLA